MSERGERRIRVPLYAILCLAAIGLTELIAFIPTRLLLPYLPSYVMTGPLDARIPCVPAWVTVYCLCFPYWPLVGLWVLTDEKPFSYRFTAGCVLGMLLTGAVFLAWPGTMERPELPGSDVFSALLRLVYLVDSPENLCPSLHVLMTYYCFRGALESRAVPRWFAAASFVFLLLVCASVVLVKQHALIDIPTALVLGEATLQAARLFRLERVCYAVERKLRKERSA